MNWQASVTPRAITLPQGWKYCITQHAAEWNYTNNKMHIIDCIYGFSIVGPYID